MAAGKSTIGKSLAQELGVPFYDSDQEIIANTGVEISLIFDIEGEDGFRRRESDMIEKLTQLSPVVMATGGGSVLCERNQAFLKENGIVVYLACSVDQQLKRTQHDTRRPLLKTPDPRKKLEELMLVRGPIYESLADIQVKTENRSSKNVLNELISKLKRNKNFHFKRDRHEAI